MRKPVLMFALCAVALFALIIAACSKDDSPTSYGGGGGGGGPTFNFGPFAIGQSAQFPFPTAGSYGYRCIPHDTQNMRGTVNVATGGADSALVQIAPGNTLTFNPATVTIKPAGVVRWINVSTATMHTVTRP